MKNLQKLRKSKKPVTDIISYFEGKYRYWAYYSKFKWLIRKHILQQIEYRVKVMNPRCYFSGSCIKCGCETIALQMANKPCEGREYPPMVNRRRWFRFKNAHHAIRYKDCIWIFLPDKNKHILYKEERNRYVEVLY